MKKLALSLFVVAASGAYVWSQAGGAASGDIPGLAQSLDDMTTGSNAPVVPASAAEGAPIPPAIAPAPPVPAEPRPTALVTPRPSAPPAPPPSPPEQVAVPVAPAPPAALPKAEAVAEPPSQPPQPLPDPAPAPAPTVVAVDVPLPRLRPPHHVPTANSLVVPASMSVAAAGQYADGVHVGPVVDAYYGLIQIAAVVQGGRITGIKVLRYPNDRRTSIAINRQALPMLRDEVVSAQSASVDIISGATLTSRAFIRSLGAALQKASA